MTSSDKTLLVLGATSGLAQAYLRLVSAESAFGTYLLLARNEETLAKVRDDIAARSGAKVIAVTADLSDPSAIPALMDDIVKQHAGNIDEAFLAYGVLGEQRDFQDNPAQLKNMLDTNFVSAVLWMETLAKRIEAQGHGQLVVIGSVAGDRGRQSNYLYGATKAGLERVSEGMSHRFAASKGITVTLVKPGFMDTPMTDHIEKGGPLWATADAVAHIIRKAVVKKRARIYAPWFWRWILLIIRAVPMPIFHKTKL